MRPSVLTLSHRRQAGGVLPILLVLALLLAGGGYNYWRNMKAEPHRPYQGYGDAELQQLVAAYESDIEKLAGKLPPARRKSDSGSSGGLLTDRVADFEKARQRGDAYRQASGNLAGQEGVLRELQNELSFRTGGPMGIHIKRLTSI